MSPRTFWSGTMVTIEISTSGESSRLDDEIVGKRHGAAFPLTHPLASADRLPQLRLRRDLPVARGNVVVVRAAQLARPIRAAAGQRRGPIVLQEFMDRFAA